MKYGFDKLIDNSKMLTRNLFITKISRMIIQLGQMDMTVLLYQLYNAINCIYLYEYLEICDNYVIAGCI